MENTGCSFHFNFSLSEWSIGVSNCTLIGYFLAIQPKFNVATKFFIVKEAVIYFEFGRE